MRFKPYPNYKESGVEWLGDVPEHWEVKKLKYLCKVTTGDKDSVNANANGNYPFFVRSQTIEKIHSFTFDCEAVLTAGDGVGVGKVFHYINGKFDFHQRVYAMYDFKRVLGKYFFFYLKEMFHKVALDGSAKSTVDSLRLPVFLNFPLTISSFDEQEKIINYLERETHRIDTLIEEKNRFIELLKEKRLALISHAVTKGLDPAVKMKDSGVEWLGEVPEHWELMAFRRVLSMQLSNGIFKTKDKFGEGTLLVNVFDIYRKDFRVSQLNLDRVECSKKEKETYEVKKNDLFFVRSSLKYEGIATVAIVDNVIKPMVFECHLIKARPKNTSLNGRFASYLLNSELYRAKLISSAKITTMTTIDQDAILSLRICLPSITEQTEIAIYLDRETTKIDALVQETQTSIAQLKEHRIALISAAVTGKIDVREIAN